MRLENVTNRNFEEPAKIWQVTADDESEQVDLTGAVFKPAGWYYVDQILLGVPQGETFGPFESESSAIAHHRGRTESGAQ